MFNDNFVSIKFVFLDINTAIIFESHSRSKMYYDSIDIDPALSCSFCHARFTDVVKNLTCGDSICGHCYDGLRDKKVDDSRRFKCQACSEMHEMPINGLPNVKGLAHIAKRPRIEKPLSEEARKLKEKLPIVRAQLKALKSFDARTHVNKHCDNVEKKIKETCESLTNHIRKIEQDLLKELDEYRQTRLELLFRKSESINQIINDGDRDQIVVMNREIDEFYLKWNEYFSRVDALDKDYEIEAALDKIKHLDSKARTLRNTMCYDAFDGLKICFKPNKSDFDLREKLIETFDLSINPEKSTGKSKHIESLEAGSFQ